MSRLTAGDRARRLLAIIPWVASRDGVAVDEICERFALSREQLLRDLELLWFVGTPPYTPADLMEVDLADDEVRIRYADAFRRPLRLTPDQGLALVAAGESIGATAGADPDGPLARGLAKLEAALGVDGRVAVDLGGVPGELLDVLRGAVDRGEVLDLDYWSYGRDERSHRAVEPQRLLLDRGTWYLVAHCRRAGAQRTFRVDRIHSASPTGESVPAAPDAPVPGVGDLGEGDGRRVVLDLAAEGRWVVDQHPVEVLEHLDGGGVRVALVVGAEGYLERLLLALGPAATVVEGPDGAAATAARRVLERYRDGG